MSGYYFLLIPALFIDGFQAMISLGLAGVFTTAGGALNLVPVAGTLLGGAVVPVGFLLGFAVNFIISMTFGAGLIALLAFSGAFYPRYLFTGGGELIPGFNNLPFWTFFTVLCILRKNAEEGKGVALITGSIGTALLAPQSSVGKVAQGITNINTTTQRLRRQAGFESGEEQEEVADRTRMRTAIALQDIRNIRTKRAAPEGASPPNARPA